ncbi:GNAT family N-acetyltransferase [Xanthomonas sp. AmX2]|nr:GNAT family N-acetyltransferase [Xanthomonas sp.]
MNVTLDRASADEVQAVCDRLLAFNRRASGQALDSAHIRLVAREAGGRAIGGVFGDACAGCLQIDVLWVDAAYRGHGVATALIGEAERQALQHGAVVACLDTFSWQAESFYLKLGYGVLARVGGLPGGHERIYLNKRLR